jgi:hypothetical protein
MVNTTAALATARAEADPSAQVGAIVGLMAATMIEMAAGSGSCSDDDLAGEGFTVSEIAEYAPAARRLAARQAVRVIERPAVDGPVETVHALRALVDLAERHGAGLDREGAAILQRGKQAVENCRFLFDVAA